MLPWEIILLAFPAGTFVGAALAFNMAYDKGRDAERAMARDPYWATRPEGGYVSLLPQTEQYFPSHDHKHW